MGLFLIFLFVVLASIFALATCKRFEAINVISIVLLVVSAVGLMIFGISWADREPTEESTLEEYAIKTYMFEQIKNNGCNDLIAISVFMEDVLILNDKIAKHKKFHDNKFVGKCFSKKIGELEPIDITFIYNINNLTTDER